MESLRTIFDLVRSIVRDQNGVTVKETEQSPWVFEVRVSPVDFDFVLSKIGVIKTLAATFAGVVEQDQVFLRLTGDREILLKGGREEDRTDQEDLPDHPLPLKHP